MVKEINSRPVGRPPKYDPSDIDLLHALRSQGYSISAFCAVRRISRNTFYEWKKSYPDFAYAADVGEECGQAYYERELKDIGTGEKKGNVLALKENMDRQFGSVKATESAKTEINIGNMNVLQSLSDEDLQKRIAAQAKLLNLPSLLEGVIDDSGNGTGAIDQE